MRRRPLEPKVAKQWTGASTSRHESSRWRATSHSQVRRDDGTISGDARGARGIAAAGGADKLKVARSRGADELIDYRRESLRDRVRKLTGGKSADVGSCLATRSSYPLFVVC